MSKNGTDNRETQDPIGGTGQSCGNLQEDVAWLAGVMDGEGYLSLDEQRSPNGFLCAGPKLIISNCNYELIRKAERVIFAVTYRKPKLYIGTPDGQRVSPIYRLRVNDQKSLRKLCEAMHPHLTSKRRQAEVMIEFCLLRKAKKHSDDSGYGEHEVRLLKEMAEARALAVRGSGPEGAASTKCAAPLN